MKIAGGRPIWPARYPARGRSGGRAGRRGARGRSPLAADTSPVWARSRSAENTRR